MTLDFLPANALPQTRKLASVPKQELYEGGQLSRARRELAEAEQKPKAVLGQPSGNAG